MLNITIGEKEYTLEFTFEAAENKDIVQKMFNILNCSDLVQSAEGSNSKNEFGIASTLLNGVGKMVSEIPHIVKTAFYVGLLENNPVSEEEAYNLMKQYMKENKYSFNRVFEDIKNCMVDDGFFELTGITELMSQASETIEEVPVQKKAAKTTKSKK